MCTSRADRSSRTNFHPPRRPLRANPIRQFFFPYYRPLGFKPCCIKIFRGKEWRFGWLCSREMWNVSVERSAHAFLSRVYVVAGLRARSRACTSSRDCIIFSFGGVCVFLLPGGNLSLSFFLWKILTFVHFSLLLSSSNEQVKREV